MRLRKLPRRFYLRSTLRVARELLGKYLVHQNGKQKIVGRIVETEAYLGERDPASHAFRGMTPRNEVMFRNGGHFYVYFTYGMHFCANVVTEREGRARAVLLRAVEPVEGTEFMRKKRGVAGRNDVDLTNGPAKLCQAYGIARRHNGTDLCGKEIWVAKDERSGPAKSVGVSTRIGITDGRKHRWRFYIRGNPCVSKGKPVQA